MARLRLATANLLHGMVVPSRQHATDPAERLGLGAAVAALKADVIGLQEVDCDQPRSGGVDQTREVALAMDAPYWRFVPALHGTPGPVQTWRPATAADDEGSAAMVGGGGPTYGIGLVSRLRVRRWHVRRFAAAPVALPLLVPDGRKARLRLIPDEPRLAVAAVIDGPSGPFSVVNAHLSFVPGFNVRQLRSIVAWATAELPAPRFLLGDLNLPGPLPERLTGWSSLLRAPTYPSYAPRVQFDHVLADGLGDWSVDAAAAAVMAISDHCAVIVDMTWP